MASTTEPQAAFVPRGAARTSGAVRQALVDALIGAVLAEMQDQATQAGNLPPCVTGKGGVVKMDRVAGRNTPR